MKSRYVALAVAATMALGSVPAFAQSHHRGGGDHGAWQHHQRADRGNWGHHNRYVAPRYYGHGYNYRRNDDGDVFGALAIGAIAGALVGWGVDSVSVNPSSLIGTLGVVAEAEKKLARSVA